MKLKKNDVLTLKIDDITNLGFGVGRHDGAVIFVGGAVTGDTVSAKIIKSASSYYIARLENIITRSSLRDDSRCKNGKCRACAYSAIAYDAECSIKRDNVRSIFAKEGLADIEIADVTPSPEIHAYRNKAQYPVRLVGGEYKIGFFAPKTHNVCEAADCPLTPAVFSEILEHLRLEFKKYNLTTYDEESGGGLLRHIYLRRGECTEEILLTLVLNSSSLPHASEIVSSLTEKFPSIVGILLNTNTKDTNIILGDIWQTLYGRDYIFDTLGGVNLKISAPSFYQINRKVADSIYAEAKRLAAPKEDDTLLDLFCGAGSIGLSMAKDVKELIGIEIIPQAIECAKFNAENNGIKNARFFVGDAANCERLLHEANNALCKEVKPTIITLDPPRSGCDEELINFCAKLAPDKIVYISCNPQTLARDIKRFSIHGYTTNAVKPFDMFPGTGHVECICLIEKI